MYSVVSLIESIKSDLQKKIDGISIRFKGGEDTNEYIEKKPKVYAWTYDDLNGGFPLHTPSILVQLINDTNDETAEIIIHICVCNPALQDKEITSLIEGQTNIYQYSNGIDIDSSNVRSELYKATVELGEYVLCAVKKMSNDSYSFNDVVLDTPSPYMEDFPYCQCSVSLTANKSKHQTEIDTMVWDLV